MKVSMITLALSLAALAGLTSNSFGQEAAGQKKVIRGWSLKQVIPFFPGFSPRSINWPNDWAKGGVLGAGKSASFHWDSKLAKATPRPEKPFKTAKTVGHEERREHMKKGMHHKKEHMKERMGHEKEPMKKIKALGRKR
jgi:hypothetical protein